MKLLKALGYVAITILALLGLFFVSILIYYAPVLDRVYNACKYYPEAFIDCEEG